MAGNVPATHTFKGDGVTRVFPISTKIIGDDYVRIEIDGEYIFDRKSWDIVNNSIIFTVAPTNNTTVLIKVAESVEAVGLLDNQSTADIIEANIPVINAVYNNLSSIDNVSDNTTAIVGVNNNQTNINTVVDNMDTLDIIASSLGDLKDIKNHNNLTGRDQPNAHPISAITGLQETLNGLSNDGGLFPSLTADFITRDTYLSCKISPTELRAVPVEDVLLGTYNMTKDTPSVYSNLGISKDTYGDFNTSIYMFNITKNIRYFHYTSAKYLNFTSSTIRLFIDPITTNRYIRVSDTTVGFDIYPYKSEISYISTNVGTAVSAVITDTKKLVIIGNSTTGKVCIVNLENRALSYVDGTEGIMQKYSDLQLHPNGKVYGIPADAGSVLEIDPENLTYNLYGDLGAVNNKYSRGFLGIDGNIYMLPASADNILCFNPTTKVISYYGEFPTGSYKFSTGTIGTDGKIYFLANQLVTDNLYIFDVTTKQLTTKPMYNYFRTGTPTGTTVAPRIVNAKTGVDGVLYFASFNAVSNSILLPPSMVGFAFDVVNDTVIGTTNNNIPYFTYSLSNEIVSGEIIIKNSHKGDNYWVMSNYFHKGK